MLDIELKTCYNMHMMNERIKLLAEQAKKHSLDAMIKITDKEQALKVYSESYDTKFAQLIVAECAEVILKTFVVHNEIDAMHRIRDNVKQHFGVTE